MTNESLGTFEYFELCMPYYSMLNYLQKDLQFITFNQELVEIENF